MASTLNDVTVVDGGREVKDLMTAGLALLLKSVTIGEGGGGSNIIKIS